MASEVCDVHPEAPPTKETPLPEYGELYKKRQIKNINNLKLGGAREVYLMKKKIECKAKPLKEKCIPKEILLPFRALPDSAGRYLEFATSASTGPSTKPKSIKEDIPFPGWLIEMSDDQLQSVLDAKELLTTGKSLCELINPFYQAISALGADLTEEDVVEILRRVPNFSSGWSFGHFMFIAGNPWYAKKKGVLQEPIPFAMEDCEEQQENQADETKSTMTVSQSQKSPKSKTVVDRLYKLPRIAEKDNWPPKEMKKGGSGSAEPKEYSKNEQLFYSALLYCEMYDTMEQIHMMYMGGVSVPESRAKTLTRNQQTGFGVSDIGIRKLGFAEWDRPLPPLPKISPYIADFPVVGRRMRVIKPHGDAATYKRSRTTFQPLFLAVKAPEALGKPIRVTEDGKRIKSILELLASEGNCLALLPNVHYILHLSDTLMDKHEKETRTSNAISLKTRGEELDIIEIEAKKLFKPHALPKEVAKIPELITFTDAIKLREICTQIREQHWSYICQRKLEFRDKCWQLMHVDRIPCGNLRESFVYSFQVYLPEKSHLPIAHEEGVKVVVQHEHRQPKVELPLCN